MKRDSRRPFLPLVERLEDRQVPSLVTGFDSAAAPAGQKSVAGSDNPPEFLGGGPAPQNAPSRFLRLARAVPNVNNSVAFDRTDVGLAGRIVADFDFRITPGFNGGGGFLRADGLGFALLNTA